MTEAHPDLERAAQYVCSELGEPDETWSDFIPTARAAIQAMQVGQHLALGIVHRLNVPSSSSIGQSVATAVTEMLDDILREPKPTVSDVLVAHQRIPIQDGPNRYQCSGCSSLYGETDGPNSPRHADHQTEMLREAGLLKEEQDG